MTSAEKMRALRQRQKAAQEAARRARPRTPAYLKSSFADFLRGRTPELLENLDAYGAHLSGTSLDEEIQHFPTQRDLDEPLTALERAIGLADAFADAASELSLLINQYKLAEIERAIEESIERSTHLPPGDVEAMKAAWAETDRLKRIRSDLRKTVRPTIFSYRSSSE